MIFILAMTDASPTKCRGNKLPVTDQMSSDTVREDTAGISARNYSTNVDCF